jgi:hypothetical protein
MLPFVLLLGLVWGVVWACVLQCTSPGRFIAARRSWIAVIIGIGGDLGLLFLCLGADVVLIVFGVIAMSGIPIVARSLYNEYQDEHAITEMVDAD